MKRLIQLSACLLALIPATSFAQDQVDALRYSQSILGGTARFMSMGGAFTALGGDMSALTYNPAGIGVYKKSQFTFTPGFSMQTTNSTYNGMSSSAQQSAMNIQNIGLVGTWKNRREAGMWKNISLGVVYNQTNNFNENITIQGNNSKNSLTDEFAANANGKSDSNQDNFSTQQAYNAGLINPVSGSNGLAYFSIMDPYLSSGKSVLQQDVIARTGSMGETDFSLGGNYNNKLYLGISVGVADVYFNENATYTETPLYTDTTYGLQKFTYATTVNTTGSGFNVKIGAIYKIADWLRIGAAVHTPTWFSLTDNYSSLITATYADVPNGPYYAGTFTGTQDGNPALGNYNYNLTTPMRAMGGVAFIIHHQAIISADYEWVDYSTVQFSSDPTNQFSAVNQAIQQSYMQASNIRVGAELLLYPFSIRAGYAYYGNPYSSSAGNSTIKNNYCIGFGLKFNHCFLDLAYVLTQYNENVYMYDLAGAAQNKTTVSNAAITFGVNF
jgi:hypothetical protein